MPPGAAGACCLAQRAVACSSQTVQRSLITSLQLTGRRSGQLAAVLKNRSLYCTQGWQRSASDMLTVVAVTTLSSLTPLSIYTRPHTPTKTHTDTPHNTQGWQPSESDMSTVVAIHNAVNERAWAHVLMWEALHACDCPEPKLLRFQGRPSEYSPKAKLLNLMVRVKV